MTLSQPTPAVSRLPTHVAIIMDGNGRWAKARGLPRSMGHRKGADAVREAVVACRELGIGCLTLYAFSSENWKRPASEVFDLMDLLRLYIRREIADLHKNGVRVRIIGDRSRLDGDIQELIRDAEARTKDNRGLTLVIALNYGAQNEIVVACQRIAERVKAGEVAPADIDAAMFARYLETADLPDPDLVIRTSGEQRLSNFLLWQSAYAELMFLDVLWPDFTKATLDQAIAEFGRRERRFGGHDG